MLYWSDLHPGDARPAAAGPAAAALLAAALQPEDTVLLAGPHSFGRDHRRRRPGHRRSTCCCVRPPTPKRSRKSSPSRKPAQVFCGALDRFTPASTMSVRRDRRARRIGPTRRPGHPEADLDGGSGASPVRLAPTGRLLLGAENSFGFERLIQPAITAALPRDEDWARDVSRHRSRRHQTAAGRPRRRRSRDRSDLRGLPVPGRRPTRAVDLGASSGGCRRRQAGCRTQTRAHADGPLSPGAGRNSRRAWAVELAPAWYLVSGAERPDVPPPPAPACFRRRRPHRWPGCPLGGAPSRRLAGRRSGGGAADHSRLRGLARRGTARGIRRTT